MNKFLLIVLMIFGVNASAQQAKSVETLYRDYLNIKDALATDNSAKAVDAAKSFSQNLTKVDSKTISTASSTALKKDAAGILNTKDIKAQRTFFDGLSNTMVEVMGKNKISNETIFVQYCPMAKSQWLSDKKEVRNPYYGSSMLECGYVKSEIK